MATLMAVMCFLGLLWMLLEPIIKEWKEINEISQDSDLLARQTDNRDKGAGIPQSVERSETTSEKGGSEAAGAGVLNRELYDRLYATVMESEDERARENALTLMSNMVREME